MSDFQYVQTTGALMRNGTIQGMGYSGFGPGKDNPAMEAVPDVGPIPKGLYVMGPASDDHPKLGPCVMPLTPRGHDAHGRTEFFVHGNNKTGDASHGCIILAHGVRLMLAASPGRLLEVV